MNGIDFLKSCTTNVRTILGLFDIQYTLYRSSASDNVHNAVADLRERHVLCTSAKDELWVFGALEPELKQLLETQRYSFSVHDGNKVGAGLMNHGADGTTLKSLLLEAVERSLVYALATESHIVRLGAWSWLFTKAEAAGAAGESLGLIISLHPTLTDDGTLYISTTINASSLSEIPDLESVVVADVILAPSARKARLLVDDVAKSEGDRPHPERAFSSSLWKGAVSEAMRAEGIDVDVDGRWSFVELEDKLIMLWPTQLCFVRRRSSVSQAVRSCGVVTWDWWFSRHDLSGSTFQQPLAAAETAFNNAAERAKIASALANLTVPENGATFDGAAFTSDPMAADLPLATSPPFNQRTMDQQTAMLGIYPTPPDGFVTGNTGLQHPTSDDQSFGMQPEHGGLGSDLQLTNSIDSQQRVSPNEAESYQRHSDDLFGDMDPGMNLDFGVNEIGDADFDYFDEPDDLALPDVEADAVEEDIEMTATPQHPQATEAAAQMGHASSTIEDPSDTNEHATPSDHPQSSVHSTPQTNTSAKAAIDQYVDTSHALEAEDVVTLASGCQPKKPLSPFGIRERLLPPPIPASAMPCESADCPPYRRQNTFEPIAFNEGLNLGTKYGSAAFLPDASIAKRTMPDISLPLKPKKKRLRRPHDTESSATDTDSSGDAGSFDTSTSMSDDEDLPPRLPWDTKKRRRTSTQDRPLPSRDEGLGGYDEGDVTVDDPDEARLHDVLQTLLRTEDNAPAHSTNGELICSQDEPLQSMCEVLSLRKPDLMHIAQIVSEQATSSASSVLQCLDISSITSRDESRTMASAIEAILVEKLKDILPEVNESTIAELALVREPHTRPMSNLGKAPQSGPLRPSHRDGSVQMGPDYFPIPPPYVRIKRNSETWEMLPPALPFWSALGLGPVNGDKDLRTVSVVPGNMQLVVTVHDFVAELGRVYEGHKLGTIKSMHEFDEDFDEVEGYMDSVMLVSLDEDDEYSLKMALKAYAAACWDLGKALASVGHKDPDRTIVVFMVNPFDSKFAEQCLYACFWQICKAYRQSVPKTSQRASRSDIVLQMLPVSLLASPDGLVILDAQQMGGIATEVYDRSPPSPKIAPTLDIAAALPILATPAVELTGTLPKRIGFQLSTEPPSDLLHEGSVLHLAYALSADRQWVSVCWIDCTGRYQATSSLCLRGKSFKAVAAEIWERTLEILAARDVTWRVIIVSNVEVETSVQDCWRALARSKTRKQMLHVTLLSIQADPSIQLMPPPLLEGEGSIGNGTGQGAAFLTPASTPHATNTTVSPDASGQINNAPPTPAPSEAISNAVESDPDAQLVDLTDETWGMLLAPPFICRSSSSPGALAKGLLLERGDALPTSSTSKLHGLEVSLHWDLRVRPGGTIDEGPARQAEVTLREVLKLYRHLCLLAKVRHLRGVRGEREVAELMPIHIICAERAADALNGFLQ